MITQPTKGLTTIEEVMTHVLTDTFYKGYSWSFYLERGTKKEGDNSFIKEEIFSHYIEAVLNMDKDRVLELCANEEFKYYSAAMIRNLAINKSSPLNIENRRVSKSKHDTGVISLGVVNLDLDKIESLSDTELHHYNQEQSETLLDDIGEFLNDAAKESKENWYDMQVFNLYYNKHNSYRKMAKETEIPVSSLYYSVKKSKQRIKNEFETQYNNILKDGTD